MRRYLTAAAVTLLLASCGYNPLDDGRSPGSAAPDSIGDLSLSELDQSAAETLELIEPGVSQAAGSVRRSLQSLMGLATSLRGLPAYVAADRLDDSSQAAMSLFKKFSGSAIYRYSNWERPYSTAQSVCNGSYFPVAHVENGGVFLAVKTVHFDNMDSCLRAADGALARLRSIFEFIEANQYAASTGFVYSLEIGNETSAKSRDVRQMLNQGDKSALVNFDLSPEWKERFELSKRLNAELFAANGTNQILSVIAKYQPMFQKLVASDPEGVSAEELQRLGHLAKSLN